MRKIVCIILLVLGIVYSLGTPPVRTCEIGSEIRSSQATLGPELRQYSVILTTKNRVTEDIGPQSSPNFLAIKIDAGDVGADRPRPVDDKVFLFVERIGDSSFSEQYKLEYGRQLTLSPPAFIVYETNKEEVMRYRLTFAIDDTNLSSTGTMEIHWRAGLSARYRYVEADNCDKVNGDYMILYSEENFGA